MEIDCRRIRIGLLPIAVVLATCICLGPMRGEINAAQAEARVYYVDQGGSGASDENPGTSPTLPWRTLKKANDTLKAGDTVVIAAGAYEAEINPRSSGAAGAPITYVAKAGERPIVRHVVFLKKDYIRIIGLEITQNSKTYRNAVEIYGAHHCEILNNYIHHTVGQGIRNNAYYGHSNHTVIRGNTIAYPGYPQALPGEAKGASGIGLLGNYNLIEYNDIAHTTDFVLTNGGYNIIRNNYLHDFKNSDFPDGSGDAEHVDIWQPYGVPGGLSDHNVFECNWASDNVEHNSHFNQIRDETRPRSGEKQFVIRGNVALRMGSYACQFGAIDNVHFYNNTLVDLCCSKPDDKKAWVTIGFNKEGDDPSVGNFVSNNIFYAVCRPQGGKIISVGDGCSAEMSNNACEQSGMHPSCTVTADIRFADYAKDGVHLDRSSRAIGAGRPLTVVTSPPGTGTSFAVQEAGFFIDGFSITSGDSIRVGTQALVTVSKVDHAANTLSVSSPISWKQGDPVVLAYQPSAPDIGAFQYRTDYSYDVTLRPPTVTPPGKIRLVAAASRPENVRFVVFYVDNIPVGTVATEPFTLDWDGAQPGREYHLTATAYSRFASRQLTKSASIPRWSLGGGRKSLANGPPRGPT